MPVAIAIRFPSGRFHATPWGHHVNEGLPEWPPSPWRLLRALVATWKRKLANDPGVGGAMPGLLGRLTAPPSFYLPPATLGHTRHYMPLKFPDRDDRTKVFDAFVVLERGDESMPREPDNPDQHRHSPRFVAGAEVVFLWPEVVLAESEEGALEAVLGHLGYLGRAESWCEARLDREWWGRPDAIGPNFGANCWPLSDSVLPANAEPVRVLAPDPATWDGWSFGAKRPRPEPPWNLLAETADLHAERWSDPPGSRWLVYLRPAECFLVATPSAHRPLRNIPSKPTVARFVIDAPVLPRVEDTLPLAEQVRRALMSLCRNPSVAFSGRGADSKPLRQDHQHAYYLPADEEDTSLGRLTHVTVFARMGFGDDEVRAIESLRRLTWPRGEAGVRACHPYPDEFGTGGLSFQLVGLGQVSDFGSSLLFRKDQVWESATPFLASRHPKRRGLKRDRPELLDPGRRPEFVEGVLRGELGRWPEFRDVQAIEPLDGAQVASGTSVDGRAGERPTAGQRARRIMPGQFRRFRRRSGDDGGRRPLGTFRITFDAPVEGPIALGHSCHFGLGLFIAGTQPGFPDRPPVLD